MYAFYLLLFLKNQGSIAIMVVVSILGTLSGVICAYSDYFHLVQEDIKLSNLKLFVS